MASVPSPGKLPRTPSRGGQVPEKARISMNLLRFRQAAAMLTAFFLIPASFAQETGGDKVDLDALDQIKAEALQHSQVMENLFWMSEVYGPRVTNSRNHKLAAEWAMKQMQEWGLRNVHLEKWPFVSTPVEYSPVSAG